METLHLEEMNELSEKLRQEMEEERQRGASRRIETVRSVDVGPPTVDSRQNTPDTPEVTIIEVHRFYP